MLPSQYSFSMSTNKLGQAISNQPDINLPTQAGLIVNTQFLEPVYVYGAHIVMVQKKDRPRKNQTMNEGKHNNKTGSECYRFLLQPI